MANLETGESVEFQQYTVVNSIQGIAPGHPDVNDVPQHTSGKKSSAQSIEYLLDAMIQSIYFTTSIKPSSLGLTGPTKSYFGAFVSLARVWTVPITRALT